MRWFQRMTGKPTQETLDRKEESLIENRSDRPHEFLLVTKKKWKTKTSLMVQKCCMFCEPNDDRLNQMKFWNVKGLGNDIQLIEDPELDIVYLRHPYDDKECIPSDKYMRIVTHLKEKDIQRLMLRLGLEEFSCAAKLDERRDERVESSICVTSLAEVEGQIEKFSNLSTAFQENFRVETPDTRYLLRVKDSPEKELRFDISRIGEDLKFFDDPDLQDIVYKRCDKWVSDYSVSTTFYESEFFDAATKLFGAGIGKLKLTFGDSREKDISLERSVKFFTKKYFTEQFYDSLTFFDNSDEKYGKLKEEGDLFVQNETTKGWDSCKVSLREKGILIFIHDGPPDQKKLWYPLEQHRLVNEFEVLPDNARRSRFSKKFPMSIPTVLRGEHINLILAAETGREMWRWATLIRWLFEGSPKEDMLPSFSKPIQSDYHHVLYEDPIKLQNMILKICTYKNFPAKAISFQDIETGLEDYCSILDLVQYAKYYAGDQTITEMIQRLYRQYKNRFETIRDMIETLNEQLSDDSSSIESDSSSIESNSSPIESNSSSIESNGSQVASKKKNDGKPSTATEKKDVYTLPAWTQDYEEMYGEDLKEFQNIIRKIVLAHIADEDRRAYFYETYETYLREVLEKETFPSSETTMNTKADEKTVYALPAWTQDYEETYGKDLEQLRDIICEHVLAKITDENERADFFEKIENRLKNIILEDDGETETYSLPDWVKAHHLYGENAEYLDLLETHIRKISASDELDKFMALVESTLKNIFVKDSNFENRTVDFGVLAYKVICGCCIQVNEKCFELIMSAKLYDFRAEPINTSNSPISLLCEGNYNESRQSMIDHIFIEGKSIVNDHAGYYSNGSFTSFVCKPSWHNLGGETVVGGPVHTNDKELCRQLIKQGDSKACNERLQTLLIESSRDGKVEFKSTPSMFEHTGPNKLIIPKDVSFMKWGCHTLTKLDLSHNNIVEIPDELYEFVNLTHLSLEHNSLIGISFNIQKLSKLKALNLADNLIEELPSTLEYLDQLTHEGFSCDKNPITSPPKVVWSKGIEDVRRFFKNLREYGKKKNSDVRVLVLGLSEAGKTSLIKGLENKDPQFKDACTRKGDRTVGIERTEWKVDRGEFKDPANLIMFDFAGQQEYYITHHIFLSKRCLYVLAFNLSNHANGDVNAGLFEKQISFWWKGIENRVCDPTDPSATPKIILVGTHADLFESKDAANKQAMRIHKAISYRFQIRKNVAERELKKLNNDLKKLKRDAKKKEPLVTEVPSTNVGFCTKTEKRITELKSQISKVQAMFKISIAIPEMVIAISSKDMYNIDKLQETIAQSLDATGLNGKYFPELDEELPNPYFKVRSFIREQVSKSVIQKPLDLDQYYKCIKDVTKIDKQMAKDATEFCHDLGDVLFYEKIGVVFLQPQFLINAFKAIIRHDHTESTTYDSLYDGDIDKKQFGCMKDKLLTKGELKEHFLQFLWRDLDIDLEYEKENMYGKMINLLEKFDVAYVAEWETIDEGDKKPNMLLVPEFQPLFLHRKWPPKEKKKNQHEIQRWIYVRDKNPPSDLLKRLQVRLFTSRIFPQNPLEVHVSQEQIHITDRNFIEVYLTTRGRKEDHFPHNSEVTKGLCLNIRGEDKKNMWSLFFDIERVLKILLQDWPGLAFQHSVVHMTNEGHLVLESVRNLENERKKGNLNHKFVAIVRGFNVTEDVLIEDVLGPAEPSYKKNSKLSEPVLGNTSLSTCNFASSSKRSVLMNKAPRLSYRAGSSKSSFDQDLKVIFKNVVLWGTPSELVDETVKIFHEKGVMCTNDLFDYTGDAGVGDLLGARKDDLPKIIISKINKWLIKEKESIINPCVKY